jgi:phage shock protein A
MDNLEAQVEAQDLGRSKSLHDEFAELARDDKVESELEALKANMAKRSEH